MNNCIDIDQGARMNLKKPYESLHLSNGVLRREDKKRIKIQEHWRKEEVLLQKIINSLEQGIIVVNQSGQLIYYNEIWIETFKLHKELLESKDIHQIFHYLSSQLKDSKEFLAFMERIFTIEEDEKIECTLECTLKDGRIFKISTTSFEVGNRKGWIFNFSDISQEKLSYKLQEEIEKKDQILSENKKEAQYKIDFYTSFSHELKTPINIISAVGHMLKKEMERDTSKAIGYIDILNVNCNRLIRNINNSIDINKIDTGFYQLHKRTCNIVPIVEEVVQSAIPYMEKKNIKCIFDTDEEEIFTKVDINAIERIILNLLSNAIKFTPPEGEITVRVAKLTSNFKIVVEDTGIGIEKTKFKKIFSRYNQESLSLKHNPRGSGIGLHLSKNLVEMHDGKIFVDSVLGKGSAFTIVLPIEEMEAKKTLVHSKIFTNNRIDPKETACVEMSELYS